MSNATVTPYCSVEYADGYFSQRLNAEAWSNADASTRERALTTATRFIDGCTAFYDRYGAPVVYDSASAPDELREATAEEALYLLNLGFDPTQVKKVLTLGIKSTDGTVFDKAMVAPVISLNAVSLINAAGGMVSDPNSPAGVGMGHLVK